MALEVIKLITEKDIIVCNFDVTPDSLIKPSALFKYYQQAASENTDTIGLPFEKMLETEKNKFKVSQTSKFQSTSLDFNFVADKNMVR